MRDWVFNFQAAGKKGETKVMETLADCDFIGEVLMVTPGAHITSIKVGGKEQDRTTRLVGLKPTFVRQLDVCNHNVQMTITVEFDEDCTFDCSVFGKAANVR